MATWELHDGKQQVGPLEEDRVIQMIAEGLPATTMVRPAGSEQWKGLRVHAPFAIALEKAAASASAPQTAPSSGYGPPPGDQGRGYAPPAPAGYQAQAHAPLLPPAKKGMSTAGLIAIVACVVVMGSCVLCVFAGAIGSASKAKRDDSPAFTVATPPTASPVVPVVPPAPEAAKGPAEPDPPLAAKASEVPQLEAKLAGDKAYQGIWAPSRRADLKLLLTALSQYVASSTTSGGRMSIATSNSLKTRKLIDASATLVMILFRKKQFPDDFMRNLRESVASSKNEPNLGVWSPERGATVVDYSALAAWLNRDNPEYIRNLLAAKKRGPLGWPNTKAPLRPWLASEKAALQALESLGALFPPERDRLNELLASKYGEVDVERVQIETLLSEYKGNEVRADAAYKGKVIETTGIVGHVKKDITDTIYVALGTGANFEIPVVQCFFDDRLAKKAATLNKGDRVTVRGTVSGLMMNVLVKDCEFVD